MSKLNKVPNFKLTAKNIIRQRPRMVAIESQKFFKESFVKGGFTDDVFHQWLDRKSPLGGKKVLIGGQGSNTMNLMQSVRPLEVSEKKVRVGSDLEYSEIHNDGGIITVTAKMKKFWWAKYFQFAGSIKKTKGGKTSNSAKNQRLNAKAEYCRNMALMEVGSKIKMPKRQYIGESKTLFKQFEDWFASETEKLK
ncbi:hypothetical protein [Dysgonomonas sp. ZJ279]|uniref:hypothetical protein n=1 Tax=Dysgonomonas sp. ZJ279 TaxID=2709796 RepID=UPI0013ED23B1|nr:hypothetical protein [Dysgonomonas sp. ZJ279]